MIKSDKTKYEITIGWLYPDLMNTYGDRGNIIVLQKRAEWRGIKTTVKQISIDSPASLIKSCDFIFMGGAQDTQQEIVSRDLLGEKGEILIGKIEAETPGLYICGAYQFLGKYYKTADHKELKGLGVFPLFTENPGVKQPRLIGNVMIEPQVTGLTKPIIGFENHGGRTYLEYKNQRLGDVKRGYGNNGKDGSEGIAYKNSYGTYLHGPILPKNPEFADLLITLTLEHKYKKTVKLEPVDDLIETKARETVKRTYF